MTAGPEPSPTSSGPHRSRRDFIVLAGASAASALVGSRAAWAAPRPAPVLVDLSKIEASQQIEVQWNGRLVFIRHRTPKEIAAVRAEPLSGLRDPQADSARVKFPQWLIVFGECTHAGCRPNEGLGRFGGWLCPCHGSQFDVSGRVRAGPAERNLEIPDYRFRRANLVEIGVRAGRPARAGRS